MKREPIKAEYRVSRDGNKIVKSCLESEVRELESYTASLEQKLKIAEEALETAVETFEDHGYTESDYFLYEIKQALRKLKEE